MSKFYFLHFLFFLIIAIHNASASDLNGSAEGGITIQNGNSETQFYYGGTKLNYDYNEKWKNIFKARGENKKENQQRSKEEYRGNNQTRYAVSNLSYRFLELEYVSDRFGGYIYRISETLGVGRNVIKNDNVELAIQAGTGIRQAKLSDGDKEDSAVVKFGVDLNWVISPTVSFNEDFDIAFTNDTRIIKSDANLKVKMTQYVYLKFNLFAENKSNVPQGIKNTDTRTMVILGYDF